MKNNHFIIDFETFGQDATKCAVINCAYFAFDWNKFSSSNPYTFEELLDGIQLLKLDVQSQVKELKYEIQPSSLDFWQSLGPEVRKQIKPTKQDISVVLFCDSIIQYIKQHNINFWWSRSNTFDPIILMRLFRDVNKEPEMLQYLKYWKVRDIRTFIDAKFDFQLKSNNSFCPYTDVDKWNSIFKNHDSIHDVAADILRLQKIKRVEMREDND